MLSDETRLKLISAYRDGPRALAEAVASLSTTDLDRHAGNDWTAREVIHHIADFELIDGVRLRRLLAEDNPVFAWVDEEEHARRLHYERSIETSVGAFQSTVLANVTVLERLTDAEWSRAGTLAGEIRITVDDWLTKAAQHAHDHVAQVLRAAGHDVI